MYATGLLLTNISLLVKLVNRKNVPNAKVKFLKQRTTVVLEY